MLTFKSVDYNYKRGRTVFSDLNLELEAGKIYGLFGKNGAGKTTLLKLACGLLYPKNGEIRVMGATPSQRTPEFLSNTFIIPEEFTMPPISPVEYAANYGFFYPKFNNDQFANLLQKLEVNPIDKMHKMSFGQQKKAYIAFAIACNTAILIMDEPTNGLDIPSKSAFRRVIASEMNDNRTIVISTHQVRDLDQLIDTIVIIEQSKILLNASIDKIANKLLFKHITPTDNAIYWEQTPHGAWGVVENTQEADSHVDIEILFNAAMVNPAFFMTKF